MTAGGSLPGPVLFAGPILGGHADRIPSPAEAVARRLTGEGVEVHLTSRRTHPVARGAEMARDIVALARRVERVVVLVYSGRSFAYAALAAAACRRARLPCIFWLHGGGLPAFAASRPARVRRVLSGGAAWIVPSTFLARELAGLVPEATVIPNLIDLGRLTFRPRAELTPRLLWMRAFVPHARPRLAVETLAELLRTRPGATLTMAGPDQGELEATRRLADRLGLTGRVGFAGFLGEAEKAAELDRHDIFLHTNSFDNAPISLLEVAACGLPIVGCAVGGVADLLEPGRSCLLSEEGRPRDLAAAIDGLLADPARALRMATAARETAQASSWPNLRELWLDALSRPVDAGRRGASLSGSR